jgi:hypothetical protein
MRTSIEIPDPLYRAIKIRAAREGTTIREIILEGLAIRLSTGAGPEKREGTRPRFPLIRAKKPGSLRLGEEGVYEYIPFP